MKLIMCAVASLVLIAGCDGSSSSGSVSESPAKERSETAIYLPAGGGVDFNKKPIAEAKGEGWVYKEYVFDESWGVIDASVSDILKNQGYLREVSKHPDFENSMLYTKKSVDGKVYFRYKVTKTLGGEKTLLRVSWTK
ncbi:hypothetical protein [Aquipseudomonas alcaligenes]|uniref:hypothetical protein n=1 Tax=Aquipseudomonas alcaligenes TaxID=43263 RepID=UPI001F3FB67B|nr:hypothetical protein [Pseudomonas alcaligenes]